MNQLFQLLQGIFRSVLPWIVIAPWEQALRVRGGKRAKLLFGGIHLRIPMLDMFYVQQTRTRSSTLGRQTLTTQDGKSLTVAGAIVYHIDDMHRLYSTLHHAEDTIQNLVRSAVANYVATHPVGQCNPLLIETAVNAGIDLIRFGIGDARVMINEWVVASAYRVVGDYSGMSVYGTALDTHSAASNTGAPTP